MRRIDVKKYKFSKENIALTLILILSAVLNFANIRKEGYANQYYAAAVKSMAMSFKNFFFVAFDPSGFVSIDKPPLGFWLQAISVKIFGFNSFGIMFPQALSGVISVYLIYRIVKRSFGRAAGLMSALMLSITPVFVAVSRNNTIDNTLVMILLFACWALSIAAEKGKFKYLILCMVLIGIGFNVKMLQAYMILPAVYITYLLSTATTLKKRIMHLAAGTVVLLGISLSGALIVDSVPANSRPYVDSSTNNTVMELIVGHNGAERFGFGTATSGKGGRNGFNGGGPSGTQGRPNLPGGNNGQNDLTPPPGNNGLNNFAPPPGDNGQGNSAAPFMDNGPGGSTPPSGGNMQNGMGDGQGGGTGGLAGGFGSDVKAGLQRLFSKNTLSDQIVWFIPLALFGFIAAALMEKLKFNLDNKRKQALVMWFMWFLPEFIYFSFNTGLFHSYYLTMLAPPIAALAGIGVVEMWELYKERGWKAWFLPAALIANGIVQMLMLNYFKDSSSIFKVLIVLLIILCFVSSVILCILNLLKIRKDPSEYSGIIKPNYDIRLKKILLGFAITGLLITPFIGSSAAIYKPISSAFPAAGLELLSASQSENHMMGAESNNTPGSSNSKLIEYLEKNKGNSKYLLVVSSSNSATDIIIKTGEPVMSLGGFLGSDKIINLNKFKELVKKGEVRYVMLDNMGSKKGNNEIMNWVIKNGKAVSQSEYSTTTSTVRQTTALSAHMGGFSDMNLGQLYKLKSSN